MSELDAKALEMCAEMREVDDSHGMYSDHEGDKEGPTWHLWQQGYANFKMYCQRAIADHEQALFLWRNFVKLNEKRKPRVTTSKEPSDGDKSTVGTMD